MESIIFIIAWIVIGTIAMNMGTKELEKYVAELNHPDELDADEETLKANLKEAGQDVADAGKEICNHKRWVMIVIDLAALAVWPVLVPMLLYRINQARKGHTVV